MSLEAKIAFIRRLQQCQTNQLQGIRLLLTPNAQMQIRADGATSEILIDMIDWAMEVDEVATLAQAAAAVITDAETTQLANALINPPPVPPFGLITAPAGFSDAFKKLFVEFLCENFNENTLPKAIFYQLGQDVKPSPDFPQWVVQLVTQYSNTGKLNLLLDACTELRVSSPDAFLIRRELFAEQSNRAALIQDVGNALGVVSEQLQDAQIKILANGYRSTFEHLVSGLEQLENYKQLHALLHHQQKQLPTLLDYGNRFPDDLAARKMLSPERMGFTNIVSQARKISAKLPTRLQEDSWIDDLDSIRKELTRAWSAVDPELMRQQLGLLPSLMHEMSRIDTVMAYAIYNFPVPILVNALTQMEGVVRVGMPSQADSIATGRIALEKILPRLVGLAKCHNEWQWLDKELAGIESSRDPRPEKRVPKWPRARERLQNFWCTFDGAEWAVKIKEHVNNWEQAVGKLASISANGGTDQALRQKLIDECELEADSLRACTMNQFFGIDEQLKEQSMDLGTVSQSAVKLLQSL